MQNHEAPTNLTGPPYSGIPGTKEHAPCTGPQDKPSTHGHETNYWNISGPSEHAPMQHFADNYNSRAPIPQDRPGPSVPTHHHETTSVDHVVPETQYTTPIPNLPFYIHSASVPQTDPLCASSTYLGGPPTLNGGNSNIRMDGSLAMHTDYSNNGGPLSRHSISALPAREPSAHCNEPPTHNNTNLMHLPSNNSNNNPLARHADYFNDGGPTHQQ